MFFEIPYSIRNCPKFHGITRNSVLRNSSNSAEFHGIPRLFSVTEFRIIETSGGKCLKMLLFLNDSSQTTFSTVRSSSGGKGVDFQTKRAPMKHRID
jgi:hypothetical protein